MKKTILVISLFLFVLNFSIAKSVSLVWDINPDPNVINYIVYQGPKSNVYTNRVSAGKTNFLTIPNLPSGATNYFVVVAEDKRGRESIYSNEITDIYPISSANTFIKILNKNPTFLSFNVFPWVCNEIQWSTNLSNWYALSYVSNTNTNHYLYYFLDQNYQTYVRKFYRMKFTYE